MCEKRFGNFESNFLAMVEIFCDVSFWQKLCVWEGSILNQRIF